MQVRSHSLLPLLYRATQVDSQGGIIALSDKERERLALETTRGRWQGLRTLALAYRDLPRELLPPVGDTAPEPTVSSTATRDDQDIGPDIDQGGEALGDSIAATASRQQLLHPSSTPPLLSPQSPLLTAALTDAGALERDLVLVALIGLQVGPCK